MRILVAPDKFKGTLDAPRAAAAIERGIRSIVPGLPPDSIDVCPIADGGDGTMSILVEALGGCVISVDSEDPLGRPIRAPVGIAPIGGTSTAIVESASTSGLALLDEAELDPYKASTAGTGRLLSACIHQSLPELRGIEAVLVCVGGTATVDAGLGALVGMGARLFDEFGKVLTPADKLLFDTRRIDPAPIRPSRKEQFPKLSIATDVTNPMLGDNGCVRAFGPQKGVRPRDFDKFEEAIGNVCRLYSEVFGVNPCLLARSGAGGGLAGGLRAATAAPLCDGFELVAHAIHFEERLAQADVVITGEGAIDRTSFEGKAIGKIATLASSRGIEMVYIAGRIDKSDVEEALVNSYHISLESLVSDRTEAIKRPAILVELAASIWAREFFATRRS